MTLASPLVQVTIYRRLRIGRDAHLDQSLRYIIVTCTRRRVLIYRITKCIISTEFDSEYVMWRIKLI